MLAAVTAPDQAAIDRYLRYPTKVYDGRRWKPGDVPYGWLLDDVARRLNVSSRRYRGWFGPAVHRPAWWLIEEGVIDGEMIPYGSDDGDWHMRTLVALWPKRCPARKRVTEQQLHGEGIA